MARRTTTPSWTKQPWPIGPGTTGRTTILVGGETKWENGFNGAHPHTHIGDRRCIGVDAFRI